MIDTTAGSPVTQGPASVDSARRCSKRLHANTSGFAVDILASASYCAFI